MKKNQMYAYARVSTKEQKEDRQLIALAGYHISPRNIFVDKQSGKDFERPAYQRMMRKLKAGDVIVVKSIDRLGRNYEEIIEQWKLITKKKDADIVVVDMPLLDTRREKNLLGTFISDLVLQLLSFVAQNERDNIRQRQKEGIAAAKARGVKFGRPLKTLPADFSQLYHLVKCGEMEFEKVAELCRMSPSTLYRKIREEPGSAETSAN